MIIIADSVTIGRTAFELASKKYAGRSVDELLLHPDDAKAICVAVRQKLGKRLEDCDVLRALLNGRKRGILK